MGQQTLWLTDRVSPGEATYNVPFGLQINGPLDVEALRRSIESIAARHHGLQTYVSAEGDDYYQAWSSETATMDVVEAADAETAVALLRRESTRGFDLTAPPLWRALLVRVGEEEHYFLFNVHHIVFDGWSSGIFFEELRAEYGARAAGGAAVIEEPGLQYDDFSEWQHEQLRTGRFEDDLKYWKNYLDALPVLNLATDRPLPTEITFNGDNASETLTDLGLHVDTLVKRLGVSQYAVYSALVAMVLDRFAQGDEVVFAIPAANRTHESLERVIGFFVNVLPIRCPVDADTTFEQLARQCHGDIREAASRSQVPFESIVAAVRPKRDPSRQPLFQVGMAVEEWGRDPELPGLDVAAVDLDSGTARYQLSFVVVPAMPDATVKVEYNTDIFDKATVSSMMRCVGAAARALVQEPERPVRAVPLLDRPGEQEEILRGVGETRPLRDETVGQAFARVARAAPGAVAVVDEAGEVDYETLERRADLIAGALGAVLDEPLGARVAVLCERTRDLPASVLAIMRLGAVYVPVDPSNPELRIREILTDSEAALLLGDRALVAPFGADVPTLHLDSVATVTATAGMVGGKGPHHSEPAYLMYTSGSTGAPKGVLISHSSTVNFVQNTVDLFDLTPNDRVLGYASVGFDVSIFEMFSALLTGASVHYVPTARRLDMDYVQEFIAEHEITVVDLPPSVMSLLEPEKFEALRIVFVGGEPFSRELVDRWAPGRRFFNGYGPTECTVTMIVHECTPGTYVSTPPIGLAMTNHVAHVVESGGHVAPQGVVGELLVAGSGLALGYHNRPDETAAAFVADEWHTSPDGRHYRTGDLVRRNGQGELVYVGRVDSQVKINGVRIEPGEIEWALRTHKDVAQAFVQVIEAPTGRTLVAYYTSPVGPIGDERLRAHLKGRLVPAMVPRFLTYLDVMPLSPSGKVDRGRLPAPETEAATAVRALRPGIEEEIWTEIYQPILGIDEMGPEDDFFDVGGASLQAAQVISRVRKRFDVEMALSRFFADSSLAAVALHVERAQLSQLSEADMAARLNEMSDADVTRLLADEG